MNFKNTIKNFILNIITFMLKNVQNLIYLYNSNYYNRTLIIIYLLSIYKSLKLLKKYINIVII